MEYHVRPLDHKHPELLPIGKEGEFKLAKDKLDMRVPDGDRKMRHYQVVAMKPIDHSDVPTPAKYDQPRQDFSDKPLADKNYADKNVAKPPEKPNDRPQQEQ
jgi:hypothetical protein